MLQPTIARVDGDGFAAVIGEWRAGDSLIGFEAWIATRGKTGTLTIEIRSEYVARQTVCDGQDIETTKGQKPFLSRPTFPGDSVQYAEKHRRSEYIEE